MWSLLETLSMRKPRIANRNPVVLETYTRRYYRAHEIEQVLGMTLEAFTYIYEQLTGETFPVGPSRIPVKAVELVQRVQALKKEGKQITKQ